MRVELIYDQDCPNVMSARELLLRAFTQAKLPPSWVEFDRQASDTPSYASAYGSPTILVNGKDVAGADNRSDANCCRLYTHQQRLSGVPQLSQIAQALKQYAHSDSTKKFGWYRFMAAIPSLAVLLPILPCPACWLPASVGILSALGLSFLWQKAYFLPITCACLALALIALAYRANTRRGYLPFILGLIAISITLVGKFFLMSNIIVYAGLVLLFWASILNAWPRK